MIASEGDAPQDDSGIAAYLKDEIAAQDARKSSFEQRGLAVVTTAGALVTLLFGLTALSTKAQPTYHLPHSARYFLAAALVLFLLAALAALGTNVPLSYQAVTADAIRGRLKEVSVRSADAAELDIALTRVKTLRDAKKKNGLKGWMLFAAMALEVAAVALVGIAVWIVISP